MIVTREFAQPTTGPTDELYGVRMDQPDPGRSGQHGPGGTAALDHPDRATSTTRQTATGDAPTGDALTSDAPTGDALTSDAPTGDALTSDALTSGQAMAVGVHTGPPEARRNPADRRRAPR